MRKPEENITQTTTAAASTANPAPGMKKTATLPKIHDTIQGYNNLVSTLKLVKKHRPFAEKDNLPKICQPEDHIEVSSPHSTSSDEDALESS